MMPLMMAIGEMRFTRYSCMAFSVRLDSAVTGGRESRRLLSVDSMELASASESSSRLMMRL